eukprot:TRINITY_DN10137_c0_g1_i1.p1 TRINITY_DN10137_c0_g1~~TRINITY_DN10137_c0_g1_i1.p1  ORF type:complete len:297 (+),score=100.26 TRINITY_DN10137_c0_g1_i1:76-966(+)
MLTSMRQAVRPALALAQRRWCGQINWNDQYANSEIDAGKAAKPSASRDAVYQGNKEVFETFHDREARPKSKARAIMFINYKPVAIEAGEENLIEVCLREGIAIPKFCYHPNLSVAGNCRMCMVQLAGTQNIIVACGTPVTPGMSVLTETRLVATAREGNVEILIINHPLDCPICDQQYVCDLQDITHEYGSPKPRFRENKHASVDKKIDPYIVTSFVKCIHCTRCTRWVQEETKEWTWGMCGRGGISEITTFVPHKFSRTDSFQTKNWRAAHLCPVGAVNPSGEDMAVSSEEKKDE